MLKGFSGSPAAGVGRAVAASLWERRLPLQWRILKMVFLTRQLKEKKTVCKPTFLLSQGKAVFCNLRGALLTPLALFWWFGTHLSFCFQLLENLEVCFNRHKIHLHMVRGCGPPDFVWRGRTLSFCNCFSWGGGEPPASLRFSSQTNLVWRSAAKQIYLRSSLPRPLCQLRHWSRAVQSQ